jgi:hypothetical protein
MNAENKIALALINLTTGSIYLKDGRLFNDDCGELPSVEELAAVVEAHPEEIGEALFNDAVNESLPVELGAKTMRRIVSGAGTVEDVERLTTARAEASRKVFSIGQELMDEAGEATAEEAAEIIVAFARGGYALEEDGFRLIGCPSLVETHQTVVAALDREPGKTLAHLLVYLHELGIREKEPATIYSISRQIAGYYHAALNLGLDELECALKPKTASPAWMKPKRSAPWKCPVSGSVKA